MPAEMEFEDILEEIGGNGKYQKHLIIFLLIPVTMLLPIINMNVIFMASVPDHWCYEPEVATSNLTIVQQKALISPPKISDCYMYDANYTEIFRHENFTIQTNSALKHCDKGWQYDKTDYEYTIATEWNLVCDDAYYPSLILTLHNLGSIIGTPILGFFADRFFPESPSWLITNQRYEEALTIVKGISEKNGKTKDSATLKALIEKLGERCRTKQEVDIKHSTLYILMYSELRKIFITLSIMWATVYLAYYGLQLNIYNLMGNEFVNFSILSLAEIPGCIICWYMLERFGRRFTLATNFIFIGLACLLPLAEYPYIDVASSILGKMFASGIYATAYQYSSELFPTVIRSSGMGMSNTVGLLATLYAPYIVYLLCSDITPARDTQQKLATNNI
ncbi:solute carrier family 22 member 5-like isoform X2 [Stegodyphus dumicola]|uniref:solute carrier family 22 member 5-like isoform X2 n=1 Tax=Stegodyphus dumicola TaxID=202533 RepID=UPI0015AEF3BC|nr:solute carrier family 22 member 5-like isoform X2 [Stegodyphus dumicola]